MLVPIYIHVGTQLYKTMTGYRIGYLITLLKYSMLALPMTLPVLNGRLLYNMDMMWFEQPITDVLTDNIKINLMLSYTHKV